MSLLTDTVAEMGRRSLPNFREVAPKMCVTIAAHLLNLRHKGFVFKQTDEGPVVEETAQGPLFGLRNGTSTRVHLMLVGDTGTGKDLWKHPFFEEAGVCHKRLPFMSAARVTDAGLVGQKRVQKDGQFKWVRGFFDSHKNHLMFWGEFDNITKAMTSTHSSGIVNSLLAALDSGEVTTIQGGVFDEYRTYASVIGCNQPARFENVSGFDRRFIFCRLPDSLGDMNTYYKWMLLRYHEGEWLKDTEAIKSIQSAWAERLGEVGKIERVRKSQELSDFVVNGQDIPLALSGIIYNAATAYHFMDAQSISSDFIVPLSPGIEKLIREIVGGKLGVNLDPQVLELMRDNEEGKTQFRQSLKREGVSKSLLQANKDIEACLKMCLKDGVRVVKVYQKGKRQMDIPTGLPVSHFETLGYEVLGEYDYQGNRMEEPDASMEDAEGER